MRLIAPFRLPTAKAGTMFQTRERRINGSRLRQRDASRRWRKPPNADLCTSRPVRARWRRISRSTRSACRSSRARFSFATTKDQRTPDYLGLNPEGKVPALIIDGKVLTEVAGTLYYLARRYPGGQSLARRRDRGRGPERSRGCRSSPRRSTRRAALASSAGRRGLHLRRAAPRRCGMDDAGPRYSIADIHLFRLYWRFVDALGRGHQPARTRLLTTHYDRNHAAPGGQEDDRDRAGYRLHVSDGCRNGCVAVAKVHLVRVC